MHGRNWFIRNSSGLFYLFGFALILFTCGYGYGQESERTALTYYGDGLKTHDLDERIKLFGKAVELDPDFGEAVYQLGICYYRKRDFPKAIQTLNRLQGVDPATHEDAQLYLRNAYTFHAEALNEKEEFEAALYAAQEAVNLDSSYARALAALGFAQFKLRDWLAAIESLQKSVAEDPSVEMTWNLLGDAFMRVEDYGAAISAYEHALALNPDLKDASFHLNVAKKRNRPELWLRKYDQAMHAGDLHLALEHLEQAIRYHPDHPLIRTKLSQARYEVRYMTAREALRNEDWSTALEFLKTLPDSFKDTQKLIAEAESSQEAYQQQRAVLERYRDKPATRQVTAAETVSSHTPEPRALAQQGSQAPAEKPEPLPNDDMTVPEVIPIPDDSLMATGQMAALSNGSELVRTEPERPVSDGNAPPEVSGNHKAVGNAQSGSSILWVLGVATALLVVALVFLGKNRRDGTKHRQRLEQTVREHHATEVPAFPLPELSDINGRQGDQTFHDSIVSETPITFDPLSTTSILGSGSKQDVTPTAEDSLMHLQETRTIQGGIRKVKRIGRYVIEKEIGRGSMGLVFRAWDPKLDRTVVVKQVAFVGHSQGGDVSRLKDRLYREARAAGKLNHDNIVVIYDVEEDSSSSYIVMEYLEGEDLKSILDEEQKLGLQRACKIASQVCLALNFAHQNDIVHRDIKPSNIILLKDDKVKVADFGIAKLPKFGTLTDTGDIIGTPFYMSPEQIEGRRVDGRSDIFSTGVMLYEMVTGIRPFEGDTIPSVVYKIVNKTPKPPSVENKKLPKELDEIISIALAKDPGDRYQSAAEFFRGLRKLQGNVPNL